jgi:hypothetical protein
VESWRQPGGVYFTSNFAPHETMCFPPTGLQPFILTSAAGVCRRLSAIAGQRATASLVLWSDVNEIRSVLMVRVSCAQLAAAEGQPMQGWGHRSVAKKRMKKVLRGTILRWSSQDMTMAAVWWECFKSGESLNPLPAGNITPLWHFVALP